MCEVCWLVHVLVDTIKKGGVHGKVGGRIVMNDVETFQLAKGCSRCCCV